MYDVADTLYCYPGSEVLRNKAGIRDARTLEAFEFVMSAQRAEEPFPAGRFSPTHYRAIHAHLFQDVFDWAGQYRTIRLSKGGNAFCYPENIRPAMTALFDGLRRERFLRGRDADQFAVSGAHFLAELNAIHPFREGNGRAQNAFFAMLSARAGHPLHLDRLDERAFLDAMIRSFKGDEQPLAIQIRSLID